MPDPQTETPGRTILLRCAELLGGMGPLAKHLNVSEAQLAAWLAGESLPPPDVILKALDTVVAMICNPGR